MSASFRNSTLSILANILLMFLSATLCFAAPTNQTALYSGPPAKYIFLFIGDGLGFPQRMASSMRTGALTPMTMDGLPAQGVTTTFAANRFITGSAAAATAIACGCKTNIGHIGVRPDNTPVKSLAELAKEQGRKVGIITSVSLDHATPAPFYAHVPSRKMYHEIDIALAKSPFDFFAGGGLHDPEGRKSEKSLGNALDIARANGFRIVNTKKAFLQLSSNSGKILAWNERLIRGKALPYALDMTDEDIRLKQFLSKAVEVLDNENGFFIMLEGGMIDWACHANDASTATSNTLAFDEAVRVALDFANAHPAETLIVVTGDHETGGMTLGFAGTNYESYFPVLDSQKVSFEYFSTHVLKEFKEQEASNCTFPEARQLISRYFGLKFEGDPRTDPRVLHPYQIKALEKAFALSLAGGQALSKKRSKEDRLYGGYDPLTVEITHALNNNAGLAWTSYAHTGVPVATSARGVGQEIFNGFYDNTDLAKKIQSVMGIAPGIHTFAEPVAAD